MSNVSAYQYKLTADGTELEGYTKSHFLEQEVSRHENKHRTVKSWLKENNVTKEKIGYNKNLGNLKQLSDFIFTNMTSINIVDMTEGNSSEHIFVTFNALLDGGSIT